MSQVWLQLLAAMLCVSIIKVVIQHPLVWVAMDIVALGVYYWILKRHPGVNVKSSMIILSGLTLVSILADFNIINSAVGYLLLLAVVVFLLVRRNGGSTGGRRPPMMSKPTIRHKWHK